MYRAPLSLTPFPAHLPLYSSRMAQHPAFRARIQGIPCSYTCEVCQTQEPWIGFIPIHHLRHSSVSISCTLCSTTFSSPTTIVNHFQTHSYTPNPPLWETSHSSTNSPGATPLTPINLTVSTDTPLATPNIRLLRCVVSHLMWLAAAIVHQPSSAVIHHTGQSTPISATDAAFRRQLTRVYPSTLFNAERMPIQAIVRILYSTYNLWATYINNLDRP